MNDPTNSCFICSKEPIVDKTTKTCRNHWMKFGRKLREGEQYVPDRTETRRRRKRIGWRITYPRNMER